MVTASQTLKMYELLNKHFKNTEDAKVLVAGIEEIIDEKFNNEKDRLATRQDMFCLKEDILSLQTRMEQGFKDQLRWLIVLMVGLSSLAVAVMKLT
ncbi:hypothetical protein Niako_1528 [Niastella koreensis GR20-10]|uniref:DUF1640 domain-containing protein n=2 Tax=Niastella koreensis TaxID=354356 RepID=G8TQZ9_NIAKG|nr:hypothetical protein [Niastella koreensis]AEV97898.1 hypothetical protein Niako_1528 [Niastella koreensis GR20-10]